MTIPTLVLTARSLRTDARRRGPGLLRALVVAALLLGVVQVQQIGSAFGSPGRHLFGVLNTVNFIALLVLGLSAFSSVIVEEKEQQTLGLLKITGLGAVSILLGKSFSRLVTVLLLFVVQVPFALLAITLGGVAALQVGASYAVLGGMALSLSGLALLMSVLCHSSTRAAVWTGLWLLVFFAAPPLVWTGVEELTLWSVSTPQAGAEAFLAAALQLFMVDLSPPAQLGEVLSTGYTGDGLVKYLLCHGVFAANMFVLAWLMFGPATANDAVAAPSRPWLSGKRFGRWLIGRPWRRALAWKDFHFSAGGWGGVLGRVLICLTIVAVIYGMVYLTDDGRVYYGDDSGIGWLIIIWGLVLLAVDILFTSGQLFGPELRHRTLGSIVALPMPVWAVCYAKLLGHVPKLVPAVIMVLIGVLIAWEQVFRFFYDAGDEPGFWYFVSWLVMVPHLVVYASLWSRWAALPFGLLTPVVFTMLLGTSGLLDSDSAAGLAVVVLLAAAAMHPMIWRRVAQRATEG